MSFQRFIIPSLILICRENTGNEKSDMRDRTSPLVSIDLLVSFQSEFDYYFMYLEAISHLILMWQALIHSCFLV